MTSVYLCRKKRKMKMSEFNIKQIQERIYQNKINKGCNTTDIPEEFCFLLYGEVGEAFDAFRKENLILLKNLPMLPFSY